MTNIYEISASDVQSIAKEQIDRKLNINEMKEIQKALDNRLGDWAEIVIDTINELTENDKTEVLICKKEK